MARVEYTDDLYVRNFGPLPLLVPIMQRIGLREVVDEVVPCTNHAHLSHGQVVCALVLNRLISPRAIYALAQWSDHVAIAEALHIPPDELNDDRLLRTLDAIFPKLEEIQGTLAWRMLQGFQVATSFLHWDLTSFFFEGDYSEAQQDPQAALVNYGHPKAQDAGKLRKQMQVGVATTEDGGVPFWYRAFSGNAAEIAQVADVMESLKKVVRHSHFTLVGDSKLISQKNMLKALRQGISFLGPESRSADIASTYLQLRQAQRLLHLQYGRNRKPRAHVYMGLEGSFSLTDKERAEVHTLRRLFIVSGEERRAARRNRRRKLAKLNDEIAKTRRNLGRYKTKTPEQVTMRVSALLEKAGLQGAFRWCVEGEGRDMRLHFAPDTAAFRRLRHLDGVYTLVTNLGAQYTIDQLLERYKRQYLSERRFADLKGPLQLRPVFLKRNTRVVSLVFIVYVALLLYCLIERETRQYLTQNRTPLPDPYTRRPLKAPTTRRLLTAFEFYFVQRRQIAGEFVYFAPNPTSVQGLILHSLGIERPLDFLALPAVASHGNS